MNERAALRKSRVGRVVSDVMDKTVVVIVERRVHHPVYHKSVRHVKKFKAHDERNEYKVGDVVRLMETRPLSRTKRWRVAELLHREEVAGTAPVDVAAEVEESLEQAAPVDDAVAVAGVEEPTDESATEPEEEAEVEEDASVAEVEESAEEPAEPEEEAEVEEDSSVAEVEESAEESAEPEEEAEVEGDAAVAEVEESAEESAEPEEEAEVEEDCVGSRSRGVGRGVC